MAIIVNFSGASLRKPGAYSRVRVAQGGAAQAQLGVVAIIGESDQGAPLSEESSMDDVTFSPEQYSQIVEKFGSGPLVDAARLALSPSNDPQILGGAQQLVLCKTNQSVKASLSIPSYGVVKAQKAGLHGNSLSVAISASGLQKVVTISDSASGDSEISAPIGGQTVFTIQVTAGSVSAASMTISANSLVTSITGTGASALNIPFAQFTTVGQLVDFISGQTGYSCVIGSASQRPMPLSIMDHVVAADIKTAVYALKRDAYDVRGFFAESAMVDFEPSAFLGLPSVLAKSFLVGGARGATTAADFQDAMDSLLKVRVNFVAALFSRDASADIADGLTDAGSSYTIDSVHAAVRSHCSQASSVKGRKERQGFLGFKGSFSDSKDKAFGLGSARASLYFQDVDAQNSLGEIVQMQPHMLAVLSAGMKAAALVGLPNTFKLVNISGFVHPDFNPEIDSDSGIDSNLAFVEKAPGGGYRFVLDNSTYGEIKDAWIYNRPSVLYAADTAAFAIRLNLETFVGQRNSDVTPETVKNLLLSVFDGLRSSGIIVPDANTGGRGFKDLSVSFEGSVVKVSVCLALVEGIDFVLADITVQRAAF